MSLYAFDFKKQLISARQASKQKDYWCLECQQTVRLRGGLQRQRHFYHLEPTFFCRQHEKGAQHLQLQSYFLQQLPADDCQIEYSFPSIRRIADVVWLSQKIVFEIQYSPISAEEVLERNQDYEKVGWSVIWILHDERYNQMRLSAAEIALRTSSHFFSNMDAKGSGFIYDQFEKCENGLRHQHLMPLPIDIKELRICPTQEQIYPLALLEHRARHWKFSFMGDLMSLFQHDPDSNYLIQAKAIETQFQDFSKILKWHQLPLKLWRIGIANPYQIFFRFLLERMCR